MKTHLVAVAIAFCNPSLAPSTVVNYAVVVMDGAAKTGVDPLLIVALVDRESRWVASAVNKKSGAAGLGQLLPQFQPPGAKLLDAVYNLHAVFRAVAAWKSACAKTGIVTEGTWLTMYSGSNPKGATCGRVKTGVTWVQLPIPLLVRSYLLRRTALRLRLEQLPPG